MKISRNDLAHAIPVVSKLLSMTAPLPESHLVRFKGDCETVQVSGTNRTEWAGVTLMCEADKPFDFGIDLKELRALVQQGKDKFLSLDGTPWEGYSPEPMAPNVFEVPLPKGFAQMLASAAGIVNRHEARNILRGINLSCDGITATDGKQLLHIPMALALQQELTIPFPMPILASKSTADGVLLLWTKGDRRCFELCIGSVSWRSEALVGTYPNWRQVVPKEQDLPNKVKLSDAEAERLLAFLKTVPNHPPYHPVSLTMEAKTLVVKAQDLSIMLEAESPVGWKDCEVSVSRDILQRILIEGHRDFAFSAQRGPFTAHGGVGEFIAMPLAVNPAPTGHPIQPVQQTQKEEKQMNVVTPKVVAAPVQPVTTNEEIELNPMDELATAIEDFKGKIRQMLDESAALSRKVKEVMLNQKQKERDFIQARRAIERIRMAI